MSLAVQSFPELYTTLIGWHLYDQLWALLHQTGIAFVPFIFIILRNIAKPYASQEAKDATSTSLRRMEIDIVATLFLILLGVAPCMTLNPDVISYTPNCQANGENNSYHPGNTNTTWDSAFTVPSDTVRVPVWWYAILSLSSGITAAANTMVSCVPDYRKMVTQVDTAQISDPALKQEVQQFAEQCYLPARSQYLQNTQNQNANSANNQTINNDRQQFGPDDTEWLGSHSFQDTYYKNIRAQQPVAGFQYEASEDINADTDKNNPPVYGLPDCATWWNDSQNGLEKKLDNVLSKQFWQHNEEYIEPDQTRLNDAIVKTILMNNSTGYQRAASNVGDNGYSHLMAIIGDWFSQLTTYPKIYSASEAAPIIQALLLLLVTVFLPFALVFSGYKPSSFITGAIVMFSLIFWSFLWALIKYTDSALMQALYDGNWFAKQTPSATLADMLTGMLMIVAPLFWFSFMAAMGIAVGEVVTKAFNSMNSVSDQAAKEGVEITKKAASTAASTVSKLI